MEGDYYGNPNKESRYWEPRNGYAVLVEGIIEMKIQLLRC